MPLVAIDGCGRDACRDDFGEDRDGDFARRARTDVESNGIMDGRERFARNALLFERAEHGVRALAAGQQSDEGLRFAREQR